MGLMEWPVLKNMMSYQRVDAPKKKLFGLQLARALAALLVVVTHSIAHQLPTNPGVVRLMGSFGVIIFFVISGYIMTLTTGAGRFDPIEFLRRRLIRIAPLYYFAIMVTAVIVVLAPSVFKNTVFDLRHIVLSMLFIPPFRPPSYTEIEPFVKLGWTLNYEMFFYLVFALLFNLDVVARTVVLTIIFTVLVVLGRTVDFQAAIPSFYTGVVLFGFVAGCWIALFTVYFRMKVSQTLALTLFIAAISIVSVLSFAYANRNGSLLVDLWLIAASSMLVITLSTQDDFLERRIPAVFETLGDASYSIYLFHMFAVGTAAAIGSRLPGHGTIPVMAAVAVVAAVGGITLGLAVYKFVELPLTNFARRVVPRLPDQYNTWFAYLSSRVAGRSVS